MNRHLADLTKAIVEHQERVAITSALKWTRTNDEAAQLLGISRRCLNLKLKLYKIAREGGPATRGKGRRNGRS